MILQTKKTKREREKDEEKDINYDPKIKGFEKNKREETSLGKFKEEKCEYTKKNARVI